MDATLVASEPWSDERATAIIAAHTGREGAALPILHDLQAAFGHIPNQAVLLIADALNLTRADEVARPQAPRNRPGRGDEVPTPRSRDFR